MATNQPTIHGTFSNLPAEILLEILPYISYTPLIFLHLRLTARKLNALIHYHERILVRNIRTCQYKPTTLDLFPSLPETYAGLATMHNRLRTLREMHTHWLQIVNHGLELHWLKGRWEQVHKAGLLLLYRVQDSGSYEGKMELLSRLPATSLACLLFKLVSSVKILRVLGPDPIHAKYAAGDSMMRSDVELAVEEVLLQIGPEFFVALLRVGCPCETERAIAKLRAEIAGMEDRQSDLYPPTLISCLRRALARQSGCEIRQTVTRMWEILSSTGFDEVDEAVMAKVVKGEILDMGMRRIF